jgi:succinate dehydrogenase/fumarate reductase flavoprotein subunit
MAEKSTKNFTRRSFIRRAASGAGILTLTDTGQADDRKHPSQSECKTYSFEIPPPPIPSDAIKQRKSADVVVIGAGTSGLVCANAAAENGAKVIVIASSAMPVGRGGSIHAFNSKLLRKLGLNRDPAREFRNEMKCHSFRIDQDKWWLWARKSGEAMDWLIDKMEAAGYQSVIEIGNTDPEGILTMSPGSHSWLGKGIKIAGQSQQQVVNTLAECAQSRGVQIFYNTTALQLVRENRNTGSVRAVIAKAADDAYCAYEGRKGIVLATGDFKDEEMVEKYCPWVLPLVKAGGGIYNGDGHKMGLWVGAAWQKTEPNAPILLGGAGPGTQPYRAFTGLVVNKNAARFGNEDSLRSFAGAAQMQQPESTLCAVWDSQYAEKAAPWTPIGSYYGGPAEIPVPSVVDSWEENVRLGAMAKADTLDSLAQKLGLPAVALKATVDRYNRFCKTGKDEDFGKRRGLLLPVDRPPFYGEISRSPWLLNISGGLRTNINMQVLDKNDRVIPGLYAVGTIVGDMYSNLYTFLEPGHNLGATCVTFGYLVGKYIARTGRSVSEN